MSKSDTLPLYERLGRHCLKRCGQIKHMLIQHYSAPQIDIFYRWRSGFIYFSVGLGTIYMANVYGTPSLQQELFTLAGLLLCGLGFVLTLLSYVRLLIARIFQFFRSK